MLHTAEEIQFSLKISLKFLISQIQHVNKTITSKQLYVQS